MSKKSVIYVFSGTGNTYIAAQKIAENLYKYGYETVIYPVEKSKSGEFENVPDPNDFDAVGFGYPIHAFNSPKFFLDFVKRQLPEMDEDNFGKRVFVFKTSGEPLKLNNASSRDLCGLLRRKGMLPGMDFHMIMPHNVMFSCPDAMAKQMYLHTCQMAELVAYYVANDMYRDVRFNPLFYFVSTFFKLQWLGAKLNGPWHKVDHEKCVHCNLCVSDCPARNISIVDGFPKQGNHCIMCMRCSMNCPAQAISAGILKPYQLSGGWNFDALAANESLPANYTDNKKIGRFKCYKKYYNRTWAEYDNVFNY
ncbi:MAG: EFR1 family ferrodoxin [Lachnospiraceae bacterium]|nr:EFR1 family ferrodoxin [Lachnospiraceae bacterium]